MVGAPNCFADCTKYYRRSITFRIVTPVLGTRAVGSDDANVADTLNLKQLEIGGQHPYHDLGVFEPSLTEYVNKVIGLVDRFSVIGYHSNFINEALIPIIPIYCDVSTVAIKSDDGGDRHEEFAAVSPSFVWNQPIFAIGQTYGEVVEDALSMFQAFPNTENPLDDAYLFQSNSPLWQSSGNSSSIFRLKNGVTGKSSCGVCSQGIGQLGTFIDTKTDGAFAAASEATQLIAVSSEDFCAPTTDALVNSSLLYDSIDVFPMGRHQHNTKALLGQEALADAQQLLR